MSEDKSTLSLSVIPSNNNTNLDIKKKPYVYIASLGQYKIGRIMKEVFLANHSQVPFKYIDFSKIGKFHTVRLVELFYTSDPDQVLLFLGKKLKSRIIKLSSIIPTQPSPTPNTTHSTTKIPNTISIKVPICYVTNYPTENQELFIPNIKKFIQNAAIEDKSVQKISQTEQLALLKVLDELGVKPNSEGKVNLTSEQHAIVLSKLRNPANLNNDKYDLQPIRQVNFKYIPTLRTNNEQYISILRNSNMYTVLYDDRSSTFKYGEITNSTDKFTETISVLVCPDAKSIYEKLTNQLVTYNTFAELPFPNNSTMYKVPSLDLVEKALAAALTLEKNKEIVQTAINDLSK
jgi:hypothetical protein